MSQDRPLPPRDEEALARYRAAAMGEDERREFERRLASDDALADALYAEVSLDALSARRVVRAPIRLMFRRVVVPAVAVVLVTLFVAQWRRTIAPQEELLRGSGPGVELIAPVGLLDAPPERFQWSVDAEAGSYRVELYDADGSFVNAMVVEGITIDASQLGADALSAGEWRVVPIDAEGFEREASERARYRVSSP